MRAARKADVHLATLPRLTTFKAQGPHEGKAMGLKIYLSSTFEDLKDYRRRVYDQLRTLRHDVIAMEDYVAADERPLDKCLRDVRDSDVYIGLFAWRYGYVPRAGNPQRRSVTELEYLEAKKHKKPCLIFLTDNRAPWPPDQMDSTTGDNDSGKKIAALRKALREKGLVSTFETPEALAIKVVTALYSWQSETSRAQSQLGHAAVEEALAQLLAGAKPVGDIETVPTLEAIGRVLHEQLLGFNGRVQKAVAEVVREAVAKALAQDAHGRDAGTNP